MGFEEFSVRLSPQEASPLAEGNDLARFRKLVEEVRCAWPVLHPDTVEMERRFAPKRPELQILVYETPRELFQVFFQLGNERADEITLWLRFAYSNPRSVYEPFCALVEWLMEWYKLSCHVEPDLAPDQEAISRDIRAAAEVRSVLTPSMDYNRKLWQLDTGTDEEVALRPGDAVARFMMPRVLS